MFSRYGDVSDCFLPKDRLRGFAFVTMPSREAEGGMSWMGGHLGGARYPPQQYYQDASPTPTTTCNHHHHRIIICAQYGNARMVSVAAAA